MKGILIWLDDYFEALFIVPLLFGMSLLVGLQVFMRYIIHQSLPWSEEITRYMFIYLMYLGISYGVRMNRHIRISVFVDLFSERIRKALQLLSDFLFLIFATVVVLKSTEVAALILRLGQRTAATDVSMAAVYAAVPLGYALVAIRLIQNIIHKLRSLHKPYAEFLDRGMHGIRMIGLLGGRK